MYIKTTSLATAGVLASSAAALDNGFGRTPPMGFNTYNPASCTINQTFVRDTINAFSDKGFAPLGYNIFGLDCGWQGTQRQSNGSITYDAGGFPDGILPLSKLANSKGFKWGMYTDQGVNACDTGVDRPGSLNHEKQDAAQLAGWNVEYMKVDNCYITAGDNAPKDPRTDFPSRYGAFSDAIQQVGIKGMLVCQWGTPYSSPSGLQGPAEWTPPLSTSFRVSDDITKGWASVARIYNEAINVNLRGLNGPGHFSDMDLLEVGEDGMTTDEQASHFAIWAMFKSPLMISTRISTMSSSTQAILQNKALIAINQDTLGKPVVLTQRFTGDNDQFAGPLANGDVAVLLVDLSNAKRSLGINFSALNISSATVTDLWTGKVVSNANSYFTTVNGHGSVALRLSNVKKTTPTAPTLRYYEAEAAKVAGSAGVASCSGCSGGKKVGNVGNGAGNTLTFTGVRTSQATQDVRFDYIDCEIGYAFSGGYGNVRGASISVNGGAAQSVSFPLTGYNWDKDVTKGFLVRLSGFSTSGDNTISISGLSSVSPYAPDFDRIGVVA
ncbi:putative alpha-galactosidase [Aureobasidium subglaciale]|nr:putative alpha-galactosidase [Aureobasidium subglaciale]